MAVLPEPTVGGVYGTGAATAPVAARRASSANRDVMRAPEQTEAPIIDGSCCSVPQGERGLAKAGLAPSFAKPQGSNEPIRPRSNSEIARIFEQQGVANLSDAYRGR